MRRLWLGPRLLATKYQLQLQALFPFSLYDTFISRRVCNNATQPLSSLIPVTKIGIFRVANRTPEVDHQTLFHWEKRHERKVLGTWYLILHAVSFVSFTSGKLGIYSPFYNFSQLTDSCHREFLAISYDQLLYSVLMLLSLSELWSLLSPKNPPPLQKKFFYSCGLHPPNSNQPMC